MAIGSVGNHVDAGIGLVSGPILAAAARRGDFGHRWAEATDDSTRAVVYAILAARRRPSDLLDRLHS